MDEDAHKVSVLHDPLLSVSKVLVIPTGPITKPILFEILAHGHTVVKRETDPGLKQEDELNVEAGTPKRTKRALSAGADPSTPCPLQKVRAADQEATDKHSCSTLCPGCKQKVSAAKAKSAARANATPGPSNMCASSPPFSPPNDLSLCISQSHYDEFMARATSLPTSMTDSDMEPEEEGDLEGLPAKTD